MTIKRVFLIVLDSLGIGEMPDADKYGDEGSDTLRAIAASPYFACPTLTRLGLFHIEGTDHTLQCDNPLGSYARMTEASEGKDTTIGHWEICSLISRKPFPTYPNGFPKEIITAFSNATGRGVLCNLPYSGTQVIKDYGEAHLQTGDFIVYTSGDSVFQIAAHEQIVPVQELYRACRIARDLLTGNNAVARVIARPFAGKAPSFVRTANRRDFSLSPPSDTLLNLLQKKGIETIGVGKIGDIFHHSGISQSFISHGNEEGMLITRKLVKEAFHGLCFTNLVDFDMLYGHRNDVDGYAKAMSEFDACLTDFINELQANDLLIITGDHGCDPSTPSTDHSREYTPLLLYYPGIPSRALGTRKSFADIGKTIAELFEADPDHLLDGVSFWKEII